MTIEIRRVRPEEYEAAGEVTALAYHEFGPRTSANPQVRNEDAWEEYFGALRDVKLRDEIAVVYVAVDADDPGGAILGTLTLETDRRVNPDSRPLEPDGSYIRMLGVHPDARGRGVGKALMDRAMAESRGAGKGRVTLNTSTRMKAARAMYEGMGFELVTEETFDDGFCLLTYELPL